MLRGAKRVLIRLLKNKPGNPYEGILFDALYTAQAQFRSA